ERSRAACGDTPRSGAARLIGERAFSGGRMTGPRSYPRAERVRAAIEEVLAAEIERLRDPGLGFITITDVTMPGIFATRRRTTRCSANGSKWRRVTMRLHARRSICARRSRARFVFD